MDIEEKQSEVRVLKSVLANTLIQTASLDTISDAVAEGFSAAVGWLTTLVKQHPGITADEISELVNEAGK